MQDLIDTTKAQELTSRLFDVRNKIENEISKIIVGQKDVIEKLLIAMFCKGHCLFVGVPGLAKTLLISTLAQTLDLKFNRIQFTPDLMPSDITGTDILEEDPSSGRRRFRFVKGPVFANIILADEINRTPPKTQAALLQAMQEYQVTASGKTYDIERPFMVFATQNPIEQEGTYPLPEAQLDRFMFFIDVNYPNFNEELEIVNRTTGEGLGSISSVIGPEEILWAQESVKQVPIATPVLEYAVKIIRASRPQENDALREVKEFLSWGAGPRASQFLVLAAKARALLDGRPTPSSEDIAAMAHPVLKHRLVPNYKAEAEGITVNEIINMLLERVGRP